MRFFCLVLCLLASAAAGAFAEPIWPGFRGPTGQGVTLEESLPLHWSESRNVTWKTPIAGRGWSSPVVWNDEVWMTTAVQQSSIEASSANDTKNVSGEEAGPSLSLRAICVDRDSGKIKSDIELFRIGKSDKIHAMNSYASPTPVVEQGRLYCHFGTYGTTCIDTVSGKKIWDRRIAVQHGVGPGSSPILWHDNLILVCDGMESQFVMALNKQTGEVAWKTDRPPMKGENGDVHKAFCTPLAIEWNGVPQLLVPGAQWFVSYAPDTGETLWQINHGMGFSNVPVPVFSNGISYLITGFMKAQLWAVPVSERGELNAENVLWEQTKQIPLRSSPAIVGNEIYLIADNGVLSCLDINSGEIRWSSRLGGNYSASPLVANGRLYFCSHEGKTTIVRPNPNKLEVIAENELDGQLMASPVPSDGAIFLRSDSHLYRIEESAE